MPVGESSDVFLHRTIVGTPGGEHDGLTIEATKIIEWPDWMRLPVVGDQIDLEPDPRASLVEVFSVTAVILGPLDSTTGVQFEEEEVDDPRAFVAETMANWRIDSDLDINDVGRTDLVDGSARVG